MSLRSRLGQARIQRRIAAFMESCPEADSAPLLEWARRGEGYNRVFVREVERYSGKHVSLETYQRAERLLTQGEGDMTLIRIGNQLKAARPDLLYPYLHEIRFGIAKNRVKSSGVVFEGALTCTDLTDADLAVLYDGAHSLLTVAGFYDVHEYVRRHVEAAPIELQPAFPRIDELLALVGSEEADRGPRITTWSATPEDALFAFRTGCALRDPVTLTVLDDCVDIGHLTKQQTARAASVLWKAGNEDRAVVHARAVTGTGVLKRRARRIIDEHESFAYMADSWTPPPIRATPLHTPVPRSVLHVLHNSLPYRTTGAANRTQGLLSGLVKNGYSISAITPPGFPYDDVPPEKFDTITADHEIQGVSYHHLLNDGIVIPRFRLEAFLASYTIGIMEQAQRDSPALIHSASNAYNALAGTVAARKLGLPSIYEVRGLNEEGRRSRDERYTNTHQYVFAKHIETLAAHEADRVIAITEGLRDTLIERGVDAGKIEVVPNGVDTVRFGPLERDQALARQYGLEGKIVLGYIGSLNWYEGHDLLFEAVRRLKPRHPEMRLLIVGGGQEYEHLLRLRSELGIEDVVIMLGKVPFEQVEAHYSLIDIAPITRSSSPVTETTSPLKPFEAMAMEKTLLSSDVAVMKEFVNGENGLLYTKDDADSLESVLERLLLDPDLRDRLGRAGREWVIAKRDWTTLAAQVAAIYKELGAG
ncbi:glycosyltransferase family 4 protein [Aeromicrobium sp.]|uniref:glycosyltransferase family 4 protein n=1 Tax=Aeromicrobium sp. TaxID=1871063 RepID=UPI0019A68DE3|nr:glycosyltransferase family 4 protein [Aeromicrobium sp.]MBC7631143.1 glycosyltransferase [Aeromicrobium sp.]